MYLTDNTYLDFALWYDTKFNKPDTGGQSIQPTDKSQMNFSRFNHLHISMRYGVYLDFFDTVGLELVDFKWRDKYVAALYLCDNRKIGTGIGTDKGFKKRIDARSYIVSQANDYYNKHRIDLIKKDD